MIVGIDIGGTFTDIVVCDEACGEVRAGKVATTPEDYGAGVMSALSACGLSPAAAQEIVHGTTVAANALIQGRGAACGLITTRGFRDLLDLRARDRATPFGLQPPFEPLIPRSRRVEALERTGGDGRTVVRVDEVEVAGVARRLVEAGAEALVISFLHGPKGENERRATEAVRKALPSVPVSAGGEVCPDRAEFERTATAAADAAVTPLIRAYLGSLAGALGAGGFAGLLRLVESDGRLLSVEGARGRAIATALSGPSAGLIGAAALCRSLGYERFITADMGGTSFDAAVVCDGRPALTRDRAIGFGLPVAIPMLDLSTVGAGGGSIARVDPYGALSVGPDSVGASPGPVCYGRQRFHPTVTDADLLLGRIDPKAQFVPGRSLHAGAARQVLMEKVGRPLRLKETEAAAGVAEVVDAKMADAVRLLAARRGVSLEGFVLVAYGGAGPLHAASIARELGLGTVVVPHRAGVFSACGGLTIEATEERTAALLSRDRTGVRSRGAGDARVGERPVYFCGEMREGDVYDRERLPEGAAVRGPAILQESGATTALPPGATARVVEGGHIVMTVKLKIED